MTFVIRDAEAFSRAIPKISKAPHPDPEKRVREERHRFSRLTRQTDTGIRTEDVSTGSCRLPPLLGGGYAAESRGAPRVVPRGSDWWATEARSEPAAGPAIRLRTKRWGEDMVGAERGNHLVLLGLAALVMIWVASGCALFESSGSFSDSSGSISDSSGSLSDSSKSSSDSDDDDGAKKEEEAYRRDIRSFTVAHVAAHRSPESLSRGLSEVALARGISDWEAVEGTYVAVGAGLAEAGVSQEELARYQASLTRHDTPVDAALHEGYASVRR
jgi:hypothetical protein